MLSSPTSLTASGLRGSMSGSHLTPDRVGRIELIIGPMFAGKTTELMRRIRREMWASRSCFVIKYDKDVRYDKDDISSHDQAKMRVKAAVNMLAKVGNHWKNFDVIGIDEGQFFPDLVEFSTAAAEEGKIVIISALDGDFRRQPFGQVCSLVPHCDTVDKVSAVCMICHARPAAFSRRTVSDVKQELIGGAELYAAACRQCYSSDRDITMEEIHTYKRSMEEVESSFSARTERNEDSDSGSFSRDSNGGAFKRTKGEETEAGIL